MNGFQRTDAQPLFFLYFYGRAVGEERYHKGKAFRIMVDIKNSICFGYRKVLSCEKHYKHGHFYTLKHTKEQ